MKPAKKLPSAALAYRHLYNSMTESLKLGPDTEAQPLGYRPLGTFEHRTRQIDNMKEREKLGEEVFEQVRQDYGRGRFLSQQQDREETMQQFTEMTDKEILLPMVQEFLISEFVKDVKEQEATKGIYGMIDDQQNGHEEIPYSRIDQHLIIGAGLEDFKKNMKWINDCFNSSQDEQQAKVNTMVTTTYERMAEKENKLKS